MSSDFVKIIRDMALRRGLKMDFAGSSFVLRTPHGRRVTSGSCDELHAWLRCQPTKTQVESWRTNDVAFKTLRRKARRHGMRLTRRVVGSCHVYELCVGGARVLENCSQSELLEFISALA